MDQIIHAKFGIVILIPTPCLRLLAFRPFSLFSMPPRTGKPTYGESFLFQPLLIVESGHIVTITIHYLRVSPSSSHIFLYPSHLFPSPLVNSLFPPSPQKLLRSAPRHMMCNHSPRESYSLCEWDHNRPSFAFNSQSDNTLHVHMCVCVCVSFRV